MNDIISGTTCSECHKGKYHFSYLMVQRVDYGKGNKFLSYKCDKCGHIVKRQFLAHKNNTQQLEFKI